MKTCLTCQNGSTPYCRHVVGILTGSGNVLHDVAAWLVRQNAMTPESEACDPDDECPAWESINTDRVTS